MFYPRVTGNQRVMGYETIAFGGGKGKRQVYRLVRRLSRAILRLDQTRGTFQVGRAGIRVQ